jgi:hypothetical protein
MRREIYIEPELEIIEISIENGFATSDTSSSMEIGEWETGEF